MLMLDKLLPYKTCSRHFCTLSTTNLNHRINGHLRNGHITEARKLFDENPKTRNIVSWNTMISGYSKTDQIEHAREMFDQMPERDIVSCNAYFSCLHRINDPKGVYLSFKEMGRVGLLRPNEFTMSIVITVFLNTCFCVLIPQLHARIICSALGCGVFVGSALMRGYTNLDDKLALRRVFDEISIKDVSSWNALILGYMELGFVEDAHRAFDMMHEKNLISWTTLINGYISNKMINKARVIFNKMSERNVVSWTAMINGYVQNDMFIDALKLFNMMMKSRVKPNQFTFSCVLDASAGCSSLVMGMQVHSRIIRFSMLNDVIVTTSLVNMYAKCGEIEAAFLVFKSITNKNSISWNSMIGGYARNGLATRALEEFEKMTTFDIKPDPVTFINVLSACAHGGLVEEGEKYFKDMETRYGLKAGMEHYACMVDLYGRAGELAKAEDLVKGMNVEPDVVVWGALIGACGLHSSLEIGEFASEGVLKLEKDHPVVFSMLSKIYGEKGVWSSVIELRKTMNEGCLKKQKANSWVESPCIVR